MTKRNLTVSEWIDVTAQMVSDASYLQLVLNDLIAERDALLAGMEGIIGNAERDIEELRQLIDSDEAKAEYESALARLEAAQAAIDQAKGVQS